MPDLNKQCSYNAPLLDGEPWNEKMGRILELLSSFNSQLKTSSVTMLQIDYVNWQKNMWL